MGKTILKTSLLLSIVIAMASSLDSPELRVLRSPKELSVPRKLINVQADGGPPELEVYLLKRLFGGNLSSGNEKKPVVQSNTNNVDCECKCRKKRNVGSTGLFNDDDFLGYNYHPASPRGGIIQPPIKCGPGEVDVNGKCRLIS